MTSRSVVGIVLALVLLVILAPPCSAELSVASACDGRGIAGTLAERGMSLRFESCALARSQRVRLWAGDDPLIAVEITRGGDVRFAAGATEISRYAGSAEIAALDAVVQRPESRLAGERLLPALRAAGYDQARPEMRALAFALMALRAGPRPAEYTDDACESCEASPAACSCSDMRCDCYGCCGYGCAACSGICSTACWEHDVCVRTSGHGACLGQLVDAMLSLVICGLSDCDAHGCYDCWS